MRRLAQARALQREPFTSEIHRSAHVRGGEEIKLRMVVGLAQIVRFPLICLKEVFEVFLSVSFN